MELSHAQKSAMHEHGYVHLPGVVPPVMVDAALRAINHSLGEGMPIEDVPRMRAQSYCPEVQRSPAIAGLLNDTPAWSLAESLLGEGQIQPAGGGQVALRFPSLADPPPAPRPHLDGMHSPLNGVAAGTISNFSMLVGVLLSDLPGPWCGNFTVWPGTHRIYEAYFRQHGPEALLDGMPKVPVPEPVQLTGRAGDVVFAHYGLAHGVAPNVSPHIRYAIFFRLKSVHHQGYKPEVMTDIWLDWPGMKSIIHPERETVRA